MENAQDTNNAAGGRSRSTVGLGGGDRHSEDDRQVFAVPDFLRKPTSKELLELDLRRQQMARFPFCPDHRDKVHGLPCRECEIERLRSAMARAARRMENEGDEYGVAHELRQALKTPNDRISEPCKVGDEDDISSK